jgi:elongator complex protein 1
MDDQYGKAYELMRQQKIDLNLLFDIFPEKFIEKNVDILKQIEKVDYLNLFLTSVKDESNSDLEFIFLAEELKQKKESFLKVTATQTKTRIICSLFIKNLTSIDKDKYILTIMTAHIRANELDLVLDQIIQMKEDETNENEVRVPPHLDPKTMKKFKPAKKLSAKEILEYVCWIADAIKLYEFSLGTYNFDLVVLVAQQT